MKKIIITIVGILVVAGGAFALSGIYKSGTYRYEITVNVQTPEGIKSGSAVRELKIQQQPKITPETRTASRVSGEAVVIDLGEDRKLFALISSGSYYELLSAFDMMSGAFTDEGIEKLDSLKVGDKRELKRKSEWPQFVMFEDLSDAMSVKAVNEENIDELIGADYSIQNIMIEITDKPIMWGITNLLPWLKGLTSNIDGTKATTSNKLPNKLHVGNFSRTLR